MKPLLLAALCGLATAACAAERPEEFAYAMTLSADNALPLRRVELPPAVYEGVVRPDLGDVRVFNADGEVVPHALMPRPAAEARTVSSQALPYFPILARPGEAGDAVDIRVERSAAGTIARVTTRGPAPAGVQVVSAYLIDASRFNQPIEALELDWREMQDGLAGSVRVEASEDLARWSTLVSQAPVVSLAFAGQHLEQKTVELPAGVHRYLRLSWPAGQTALALTALAARTAGGRIEPARTWKTVRGAAVPAREGEFEFDLGGRFPVDRLRVEMPNDNTLVHAQLLSRRTLADPWRPVTSAVLYQLRVEDRPVRSPDLVVDRDTDPLWLVRVDQKGGGLGRGSVNLQAGWIPQTLVFVARGNGPFRLAYGNARAQPSAYAIDSVVPGFRTDDALQASIARPGPPQTLAGAAALHPRPDYRTWTLWGVLILGVALLAWMAWRLARQLRAAPPAP